MMDLTPYKSYIKMLNANLKQVLYEYTQDNEAIIYDMDKFEKIKEIFKGGPMMHDTLVVYRGMRNLYSTQISGLISTSLSDTIARQFMNMNCCLYVITLTPGQYTILPLQEVSEYPHEQEILLPAGNLSIQSIIKKDGEIDKIYCTYIPDNAYIIPTQDINNSITNANLTIDSWVNRLLDLKDKILIVCEEISETCIMTQLRKLNYYNQIPIGAIEKFIQIFLNLSEKILETGHELQSVKNLGITLTLDNYDQWYSLVSSIKTSHLTFDILISKMIEFNLKDLLVDTINSGILSNNIDLIVQYAFTYDYDDIVSALISKNLLQVTSNLLFKAVNKYNVFHVILNNNVDLNYQNENGNTILLSIMDSFMRSQSKIEIIQKLLQRGVDINIPNKKGIDALGYFLVNYDKMQNRDVLIKMLMLNKNPLVYYLMAILQYKNSASIVDTVLDYTPPNYQDINGNSTLLLILQTNISSILKIEIVKHLLDMGADVNLRNKYGINALLYYMFNYCKWQDLTLLQQMLQANNEPIDLYLEWAIEGKVPEPVIDQLLKYKIIDINRQNKRGYTFLMTFLINGYSNPFIHHILDLNPDVNIKSNNWSAISLALKINLDNEVFERMLSYGDINENFKQMLDALPLDQNFEYQYQVLKKIIKYVLKYKSGLDQMYISMLKQYISDFEKKSIQDKNQKKQFRYYLNKL